VFAAGIARERGPCQRPVAICPRRATEGRTSP
jgi:hypothetical protein